MIKRAIIIILFLAVAAVCSAGERDAEDLFYKANKDYAEGNYESAAEGYSAIVASGYESGPVYYNLGNAKFKMGETGEAILYYNKALRLIPQDADLRANLSYAKTFVKGGILTPRKNLFLSGFNEYVRRRSLKGLVWAVFILYFILCISYIVLILTRRFRGAVVTVTVILSCAILFFGAAASAKYVRTEIIKRGIVTAGIAECRFEPSEGATVYFDLYEGESLTMLTERGEWAKIERGDGKRGWVKREAFKLI